MKQTSVLYSYAEKNYRKMFREPEGNLHWP